MFSSDWTLFLWTNYNTSKVFNFYTTRNDDYFQTFPIFHCLGMSEIDYYTALFYSYFNKV